MKKINKRVIYTFIVTLIVVFTSTFSILMTLERNDYKNYLQGQYSKNMYELISSVQNIRVNLSKSAIIGSKDQEIISFEEIFRYSAAANDKLHALPVSQNVIKDTSTFLAQVGDFANSLAKSISKNEELKEKDYQNIENLKNQSFQLEKNLKKVSDDISKGKFKWGEVRQKISGVLAKGEEQSVKGKFNNIQKQVIKYPSLIYDGPFSDNILEISPKVNSQKKISLTEAKSVVYKIVGKNKIKSINLDTKDYSTKIPSYRFIVQINGREDKNNSLICSISKHGGKLLYLMDQRSIGKPKIDMKKSIEISQKYLIDKLQMKNMIPTYNLNYSNVAIISYVYQQEGVLIYPDQIKVKVAMDTGEIVGIESEKYLVSHHNRDLNIKKISMKQAEKRIGKKLEISTVRLVVIPTETDNEMLAYEFSGSYSKDKFKVYINAQTGYEERIIQILDTPNGELTI